MGRRRGGGHSANCKCARCNPQWDTPAQASNPVQEKNRGVAKTIRSAFQELGTAAAIASSVASPGATSDLTPGQGGQVDHRWSQASAYAERESRSAQANDSTRDKGARAEEAGQQ